MFLQEISRHTATLIAPATGSGIIAGTRVETARGWIPVESLTIGTLLHTHDGGLRPVRALNRHWISPGPRSALICVPGGAFDNCDEIYLMPHQKILMDLPEEDSACTTPTLVPAEALIGHNGCHRLTLRDSIGYVCPLFDEEEVIWAASGVRLHCASMSGQDDFFAILPLAEARLALVQRTLDLCAA